MSSTPGCRREVGISDRWSSGARKRRSDDRGRLVARSTITEKPLQIRARNVVDSTPFMHRKVLDGPTNRPETMDAEPNEAHAESGGKEQR